MASLSLPKAKVDSLDAVGAVGCDSSDAAGVAEEAEASREVDTGSVAGVVS